MADVVKRTLTKFRRKDFPTLLERWNFGRRLGDVDLSGSKASIVKRIATLCLKYNIEEYELAEAEIIHYQLTEGRRLWKAYAIEYWKNEVEDRSENVVPEKLEDRFGDILDQFYESMIVSLMYKDAIWFHVQINETPLTPFFLVFYPNSTLVLSSPITASYRDIVLESFLLTLNAKKLKPLEICARDSQSIVELVLNSKSQGGFSAFRYNQVDSNPLVKDFKVRREIEERQKAKSSIDEYVKETFGEHQMPRLEQVHYKAMIPIRSSGSPTEASAMIEIHASFSGGTVLESMREMVKDKTMVAPLPPYLAKLPSMGRNKFSLDKKNA